MKNVTSDIIIGTCDS